MVVNFYRFYELPISGQTWFGNVLTQSPGLRAGAFDPKPKKIRIPFHLHFHLVLLN